MKILIAVIIIGTGAYFLFQPTIDKLFNRTTGSYQQSVEQNKALQ